MIKSRNPIRADIEYYMTALDGTFTWARMNIGRKDFNRWKECHKVMACTYFEYKAFYIKCLKR